MSGGLAAVEIVKVDGEVLHGEILERLEGQSVRFKGEDGKTYVFYWDELKSVDGERLRGSGPAPGKFMDQTWFAYWALGAGFARYEAAGLSPGGDHQLALGLDMFGFYWRLDRRNILGFVANGIGDAYLDSNNTITQVSHYTYGLSAWHSLQDELGNGAFLRLDLGPARLVESIDGGGRTLRASSDWGFGTVLGAGVFFGTEPGHSFVFNALYTPRFIAGQSYQSGNLSLGVIW